MRKSEPANAAFIKSVQTAKTHELSQLSNGTKRADRGACIFTQECVTLAISSCFHQPTSASAAIWTVAVRLAISGWYPPHSCHLEPGALSPGTSEFPATVYKWVMMWTSERCVQVRAFHVNVDKWVPCHCHRMGKYKAFQMPHFLLAKQWWESLRLKFNCTPGKRTMLVHHEWGITSKHEKDSDKITRLRYLMCWKVFWYHLAKHCHITECPSHPHFSTPAVPVVASDRSKVKHVKAAFIEFLQAVKSHLDLNCNSWWTGTTVRVTERIYTKNPKSPSLLQSYHAFAACTEGAQGALLEHGQIHTKLGWTAARSWNTSAPCRNRTFMQAVREWGAARPCPSCTGVRWLSMLSAKQWAPCKITSTSRVTTCSGIVFWIRYRFIEQDA